jgi:hypothetical protein
MSGAIHPLPQYAFMAWCLVKAQGQLYLFIYLGTQKRHENCQSRCSYAANASKHQHCDWFHVFRFLWQQLVFLSAHPTLLAVKGACGFGPPKHWDPGLGSRLRHRCMSAFCVVLSCVGRSLVQQVLPKWLKGFLVSR